MLSNLTQKILYCLAAMVVLMLSPKVTAQLERDWIARHSATSGFLVMDVDIAVDQAGNSYVTGEVGPFNSTNVMTIKYAADGTEIWTAIHEGGQGSEGGIFVTLDSFGDLVVVARLAGDYGVIKYDAQDGSEIWSVRHNAGGIDHPQSATLDSAGNIYVTGKSWTTDQNDYYTVKFDANGSIQWTTRWDGNGAFLIAHDIARAIAVDANGDVFVTGGSNAPGRASPDYITIKYDGTNGVWKWVRRYSGAGSNDEAFDLVLDSAGDVYVVGGSFQVNWKYVTIKYRNSDGTQLWVAIDSPQTCNVATDIALDSSENVLITGWSDPDCDKSNFNENITTIKHRADDGARLWSTSFGSNGVGAFDVPYDLVVDAADNVLVAGTNSGKFIVLQYDSLTGVITDRDIFVSGANESASGKALALDNAQNLVVAGVARNVNSEQRDILTVKYSGRGGAIYDLRVTNLVGGLDAVFSITNATPDRKQYIVYSLRGLGSTFIPQLNVTLDLANPILLTSGLADSVGSFDAVIHIPNNATGRTVWFQGAELDSTTAVVQDTVQ